MDLEGLKRIVNGPLGFSLRGATYGALLGWLHDKSKEEKNKKNSYHGMSIGAVLGALGGAGYGQFRSDRSHAFDVQELKRKIDALSEKKGEATEKMAQTFGWYAPSHDPNAARELHDNTSRQTKEQSDAEQYGVATLMRGIAKGVHEALPGLADLCGSLAGFNNGMHQGIAGALTGLTNGGLGGAWEGFKNSYSRGYDDSAAFAKKYFSDPIRYAQMYYGGDKVKKFLDGWRGFYEDRIMNDVGPYDDGKGNLTEKYKKAREMMGRADTIGSAAEKATELAITWPMLGGVFKKILSPVVSAASGSARAAPAVAETVAKAAPAASAVQIASRSSNPVMKAIGLTADIGTSPYFAVPSSALNAGIYQHGINDAILANDAEYVKEEYDNKIKEEERQRELKERIRELNAMASYWNRRLYSANLSQEERMDAMRKAKGYSRELKELQTASRGM